MVHLIKPDERLIVADCETFGLDLEKHPLLEVGFALVDAGSFEVLDSISWCVWGSDYEEVHEQTLAEDHSGFYARTHAKEGGLVEEARKNGIYVEDVEEEAFDELWNEWNMKGKDPMVGSTIQFDRLRFAKHMPRVHDLFHYRNIDVSTVKELCARRNPELYAKRTEDLAPVGAHRVEPDMQDTLDELEWYDQNFFFVPGGARD